MSEKVIKLFVHNKEQEVELDSDLQFLIILQKYRQTESHRSVSPRRERRSERSHRDNSMSRSTWTDQPQRSRRSLTRSPVRSLSRSPGYYREVRHRFRGRDYEEDDRRSQFYDHNNHGLHKHPLS